MLGIVLLTNRIVHTVAGLIVTTVLLGVFTGVFVALPPAILVSMTTDKSKLGTRIGMGLAMAGLGVFPGGPGVGAILGTGEHLNWDGVWTFAGVMGLAGGTIFCALRVWRGGFKLAVKI